jgi:AcrR family transcriptional regulator
MGRRSRSDGERTRERILEAALPLFAEHGYAGASIRTIAKAADVNVATLAYHFTDKDGLYLTVVQRLHEDLSADFPTVQPGTSPQETVRNLIDTAWAFVAAHRQHVRLLMRNVLDEGRHPDVVLDRWTDPLMQRATGLVGLFRPEWTDVQRRLLIVTFMYTITRVHVEEPAQHARLLGVPQGEAAEHTKRWLTDLALRELGLNGGSP